MTVNKEQKMLRHEGHCPQLGHYALSQASLLEEYGERLRLVSSKMKRSLFLVYVRDKQVEYSGCFWEFSLHWSVHVFSPGQKKPNLFGRCQHGCVRSLALFTGADIHNTTTGCVLVLAL